MSSNIAGDLQKPEQSKLGDSPAASFGSGSVFGRQLSSSEKLGEKLDLAKQAMEMLKALNEKAKETARGGSTAAASVQSMIQHQILPTLQSLTSTLSAQQAKEVAAALQQSNAPTMPGLGGTSTGGSQNHS